MTRRTFAGLAVGLSAASYRRVWGANRKVRIGIVGVGGNGFGHVKAELAMPEEAEITAVCDVYAPRLDRAITATKAKGYRDYQELLADKNVDAVIISTPDHWHARIAIDAMRAGKDVDVEKPMARTIEEAKEMVRVAKETGRVLAVDSEHMAHGIWKVARQVVDAGVLGNLTWSQTSRSRNAKEPPWDYTIDADASPKNLDWDRWLGTSEKVPFSKERFFRWRRFWEYGGGIITDLYYHHITPLIHVTGRPFAVRAVASGGHYVYGPDTIEVPDTVVLGLDFSNRSTMAVGGSLGNSVELPIVVRGHEANMFFIEGSHLRPGAIVIEPERPFAAAFAEKIRMLGIDGKWIEREQEDTDTTRRAKQRAYRIESPPSESFDRNFLRCVRTREKPVLDGDLGYRAQVAVELGARAFKENRVAFFDPVQEKVVEKQPAGVLR